MVMTSQLFLNGSCFIPEWKSQVMGGKSFVNWFGEGNDK
jgi:hypothetical protein